MATEDDDTTHMVWSWNNQLLIIGTISLIFSITTIGVGFHRWQSNTASHRGEYDGKKLTAKHKAFPYNGMKPTVKHKTFPQRGTQNEIVLGVFNITSPLYVPPSDSIEGVYRRAAVVTDDEECSNIGMTILREKRGSAVDAAVAAVLCIGVVSSQSCGLGGGHFSLYYNRAKKTACAINAREQAPSAATEDMFVPENVSSVEGGMAIGIPGEIKGWYELHKLGGRLPWKHLFLPTIKLCKEGYKVSRRLARFIAFQENRVETNQNLRELLTNPETNSLYNEGETMRQPKLARTLEIIAEEGPDAFYDGRLSKDVALDIQEQGGIITEADLANYSASVTTPLCHELQDNCHIYSPPPPSGGAIYLYMLNILKGFQFGPLSVQTADSAALTWHRMTEAYKHAFAERTKIGDPATGFQFGPSSVQTADSAALTWHRMTEAYKHAFAERTKLGDPATGTSSFKHYIKQVLKNLTSTEYGKMTRLRIDDSQTFDPSYYQPLSDTDVKEVGTAHVSVLSSNGDAVAITSTINTGFGSKVVGSRTGIIFNNEMDDFSTPNTTNIFGVPASSANFISPWKRPISSMSPSVIVSSDGDVKMVIGGSGGPMIPTAMTAVTDVSLVLKDNDMEEEDLSSLIRFSVSDGQTTDSSKGVSFVTAGALWFKWSLKQAIDYPRLHHQLYPNSIYTESHFPQVIQDNLMEKGHNIGLIPFASTVNAILRLGNTITANSDYRKDGVPAGF